jgi:hypothetical protein
MTVLTQNQRAIHNHNNGMELLLTRSLVLPTRLISHHSARLLDQWILLTSFRLRGLRTYPNQAISHLLSKAYSLPAPVIMAEITVLFITVVVQCHDRCIIRIMLLWRTLDSQPEIPDWMRDGVTSCTTPVYLMNRDFAHD